MSNEKTTKSREFDKILDQQDGIINELSLIDARLNDVVNRLNGIGAPIDENAGTVSLKDDVGYISRSHFNIDKLQRRVSSLLSLVSDLEEII